MKPVINIPEPCHERWDDMLPQAGGRHCLSCCKTVIDFTGWEPDQIRDYLYSLGSGKVCGRVLASQVTSIPEEAPQSYVRHIALAPMPFLKKIAAIICICFGLSAGSVSAQARVGRLAVADTVAAPGPLAKGKDKKCDTSAIPDKADTVKEVAPVIMGMIIAPREKLQTAAPPSQGTEPGRKKRKR